MSEPLSTPAPTSAPEPSTPPVSVNPLALDDAQVGAMREQWTSLGLDPAAFEQALQGGGLNDAPVAPNSDEARAVADLKTPGLSPDQAADMAAELLKHGVPREAVEAALAADGYQLAPDTRTDEEIELERALGGGKPTDYRIDFMGRVPAGMDAAGIADANASWTGWLAQVGFPPEVGPGFIERAMDVGQWHAKASEPERELFAREQDAQFMRMAKTEEGATQLLQHALFALQHGSPEHWNMLARSGALRDAGVLMHLAHQGERMAARGVK